MQTKPRTASHVSAYVQSGKRGIGKVLPRHQFHWDKWPSEFEKSGPFQKISGPPCLDTGQLSTIFRHCKDHTVHRFQRMM